MKTGLPSVSIIIPTLNEAGRIASLLEDLCAQAPEEIVVADGRSDDGTAEIASRHARVVSCDANRGAQMNEGARVATGDVLLFLHADARLAPDALSVMRAAMADPKIAGGDFDIHFEGGDSAARLFTFVNRVRRRCGVFYGDSGIFCRREVFKALGGYRPYPVMEDYEFARRLRKSGRLALLDTPIHVSARRWRKSSVISTTWNWISIHGLYYAGVSPYRLARMYRNIR